VTLTQAIRAWFRKERSYTGPDEIERAIRGHGSVAGVNVTEDAAMQIAAVYSCVRIISETVGSLPLMVYDRLPNGGKRRRVGDTLHILLHDAPNDFQTAMEFREQMQGALCLRGNAYAQIIRDSRGFPIALIPLSPDAVTPRWVGSSIVYDHHTPAGVRTFAKRDMFHVRSRSSDGLIGRSVLKDARDTFGVAIATQNYSGKFWRNDATPGMLLKHPGKLGPEGKKNLKASWDSAFGGEGQRGTAVLEEGMTVERLTVTAEDSQFLETRKLSRSEIAGLFGVPPHMIGDLDKATFSNIEHQAIQFVTMSIRPWLVRWEQAIFQQLIISNDIFAEFAVEGLLRGDIKSRYDSYAVGRNWGWLSVNDIRSLENMNPIDAGDVYLQPLNMQEAGTPAEASNANGSP
jgi:HK97 family phage portal protein